MLRKLEINVIYMIYIFHEVDFHYEQIRRKWTRMDVEKHCVKSAGTRPLENITACRVATDVGVSSSGLSAGTRGN